MLFRVWEHDAASSDQNTKLVMTFVEEGWSASGHLIQQDSESPPIDAKAVSSHIENFRGEVLSSAAERVGLVAWLKELCKSKISQTDVAVVVHKDVFRFQISVHDISRVKVAHGGDDLSADKLYGGLTEASHPVYIVIDVASRQIFEEEVDLKFVLEHEIHRVYEWVLSLEEDVFFILDVLNLLLLEKQLFVNALHSIHLTHLPVGNKENFAKASFVNDFDNLKIVQSHHFTVQSWFANEHLTGTLGDGSLFLI